MLHTWDVAYGVDLRFTESMYSNVPVHALEVLFMVWPTVCHSASLELQPCVLTGTQSQDICNMTVQHSMQYARCCARRT